MTSTVIDLLIRIKNGYLAEKHEISAVYSNLNVSILELMKQNGYIKDYSVIEEGLKKDLMVVLDYSNKEPAMTEVKIVSKPGRRIYRSFKDLRPVLGGIGMSVVSTPKGIKSDKEARKLKIGGEVLFNIW